MPKKRKKAKQFSDLSWDDMENWAGGKIVSRGRSYQQQGRVSDLAVTGDGSLIAWVNGTRRYATRVTLEEDGLPDSICTCPYELDCKHGVAVVLEYLERMENDRPVPKINQDDDRLELFEDDEEEDEDAFSEDMRQHIDAFLKGKTKAQLIELIHDLAAEYPELIFEISDRQQLNSGDTRTMVSRLRKEIRDIGDEPAWRNYWNGEGHTPDYSGIRKKLETLLEAGHADDVLALGQELLEIGIRQVEKSHEEGETAMEVASCMPVLVKALKRSSLEAEDRLAWALDAVLEDQFEVCEAFAEYLHQRHPKSAWNAFSDQLLGRLKKFKISKDRNDFSGKYRRDRLSDWLIHALERAGRKDEIIPLCEAEARKTESFDRLVDRLISERRHEEAEKWIQEGVQATQKKWPGIASNLRGKLRKIRTRQKNWPAVAAMQVEAFVRYPSRQAYSDCKKAATRVKAWPKVRKQLLTYLEKGKLPWEQKGWPLLKSGLDRPSVDQRNGFPLIGNLIDIAIFEKKPDQVLRWYDQRPKDRFGWHGIEEDAIASAVQTHAPDRAVTIWKSKAERLIAQVKPSAYREAAKYLRKAAGVMKKEGKSGDWKDYLTALRKQHIRKRRLIEILDGMDGKPIVKR